MTPDKVDRVGASLQCTLIHVLILHSQFLAAEGMDTPIVRTHSIRIEFGSLYSSLRNRRPQTSDSCREVQVSEVSRTDRSCFRREPIRQTIRAQIKRDDLFGDQSKNGVGISIRYCLYFHQWRSTARFHFIQNDLPAHLADKQWFRLFRCLGGKRIALPSG